jgi:hypothetical protein
MAKMGRPTKAPYRSKLIRLGKIEDELNYLVQSLESEKDKTLVLSLLEKLKPVS